MDPRLRQDAARARQLLQSGRFAEAAAVLEKLVKRAPRDPSLLHQLSIAQTQLGDTKAAIRSLQKAASIKPDSTLLLADLAQVQMVAGRYDDAEQSLDKALRLDPAFAFAMGAQIELLQLTGRFDEARAIADDAVEKHPQDPRLAAAYAKLAPRIGAERRAVEIIDRIMASSPPAQPEARAILLFRLVDLLDRLGEYDRAFETANTANALVPARFDPAAHEASIDRMIDAWTPQALASIPRASRETNLPILIVGMLRSGTSLVEQILASHHQVFGADELTLIGNLCAKLTGPYRTHEPRLENPAVLTKAKLDQAQREYLGTLYTLGGKAKRVTDKMPGNFAHLGLIDRMLPGARVIHCTRDPLDTAISCYVHHFQGAHPWCYRLEWIGAYQRDHDRLMDHWKATLADTTPILTVPYEDLVREPESWIPRLVEFTGLEWDDACLRPHESQRVSRTASNEQVRKPIGTGAVARHTHYDAHLGPLRKALGLTE